jgi:hypothetical protein
MIAIGTFEYQAKTLTGVPTRLPMNVCYYEYYDSTARLLVQGVVNNSCLDIFGSLLCGLTLQMIPGSIQTAVNNLKI